VQLRLLTYGSTWQMPDRWFNKVWNFGMHNLSIVASQSIYFFPSDTAILNGLNLAITGAKTAFFCPIQSHPE
jgi:hypothetical protein